VKKIIVVNGYPESGKTEFEKLISKHTPSIIYSSIDIIKEHATTYFGWSGSETDKTEDWRRFFSELKHFLVVEFDYIFTKIAEKVREFNKDVIAEVLMIDSRETEEIERFKNQLQAVTVFVRSDRCKKIKSNKSDANVENYKYDYYIDNNGTLEELEQKAIDFILTLKGE
jgi:hypothetical protein